MEKLILDFFDLQKLYILYLIKILRFYEDRLKLDGICLIFSV